jgi:hypothetical protein
MIRDLSLNDLVILEKDAKFPLPNLANPLYKIQKSIENNSELLGSFWVKITSETSLVLKPELSNLTKARAIKEIFKFLYLEVQRLGLDDSHIFIEDDPHYIKFLKKHLNAKDNLGVPLYIGRRNG